MSAIDSFNKCTVTIIATMTAGGGGGGAGGGAGVRGFDAEVAGFFVEEAANIIMRMVVGTWCSRRVTTGSIMPVVACDCSDIPAFNIVSVNAGAGGGGSA